MKSLRSHWGLALAATVFATAAGAQQYGYDTQRYSSYDDRVLVRCESQDERTRHCAADIRGDVRLVNQLSRSNCIEGRTWGWDRQGIWVGDGCRGEFEIDQGRNYGYDDRYGNSAYGRDRVVRCESTDSRTKYCDVDTRYGVRLLTQHSRSACIEGRSWGFNARGIWVSNGCRAQFQVGGRGTERVEHYGRAYPYRDERYGDDYRYGNGTYGNDAYARRVSCESHDNRYNFCSVGGTIRQAQVYRQKSNDDCRYNYSWGYRGEGIWVDRGCRAEFTVY
jgi:hypothetical protein